jgi:hypothetical protein
MKVPIGKTQSLFAGAIGWLDRKIDADVARAVVDGDLRTGRGSPSVAAVLNGSTSLRCRRVEDRWRSRLLSNCEGRADTQNCGCGADEKTAASQYSILISLLVEG